MTMTDTDILARARQHAAAARDLQAQMEQVETCDTPAGHDRWSALCGLRREQISALLALLAPEGGAS